MDIEDKEKLYLQQAIEKARLERIDNLQARQAACASTIELIQQPKKQEDANTMLRTLFIREVRRLVVREINSCGIDYLGNSSTLKEEMKFLRVLQEQLKRGIEMIDSAIKGDWE